MARAPTDPSRLARLARLAATALVLAAGCAGSPRTRWQAVDGAAFASGGRGEGATVTVSSLLGGGDGQPWLAVGWHTDAQGRRSPLGWSSADGRRWSPDPSRAVTLDGPSDRLAGLASGGGVAVTTGETQSATEGNLRPAMWHRDPDATWREARAYPELFGGERAGGLVAVAALSPSAGGFLAAGGWTGVDGHFDIGVWTSADGASWARLDGDTALSPRSGESIRAIAATSGPSGTVLAGEGDLGSNRQGLVWWSVDGRAWTRAEVGGSASLQGVVAVAGGFVAVGIRPDGSPAAWRSADGRRWAPAGSLPAQRGSTVLITSAAADGTAVVVGGLAGGRARLWRSSDGRRWRTVGLPADADVVSATSVAVAAGAGTIVMAVDRPPVPALWRSY